MLLTSQLKFKFVHSKAVVVSFSLFINYFCARNPRKGVPSENHWHFFMPGSKPIIDPCQCEDCFHCGVIIKKALYKGTYNHHDNHVSGKKPAQRYMQ